MTMGRINTTHNRVTGLVPNYQSPIHLTSSSSNSPVVEYSPKVYDPEPPPLPPRMATKNSTSTPTFRSPAPALSSALAFYGDDIDRSQLRMASRGPSSSKSLYKQLLNKHNKTNNKKLKTRF